MMNRRLGTTVVTTTAAAWAIGAALLVAGSFTNQANAGEKKMAEFILLMNESDNAWAKLSPEEQQTLLTRYFAWVDGLRAQKIFKSGAPLGGGGKVLRVLDGAVVDGPFTETKEVLTGFFIIEAADLDAAVAIARGCPALSHGESVVVRPVGH